MSNLNERDRDMSGVLFTNDKKAEEKQPDFTGNVVVNGVKFALSAWKKTSASGSSFLSVAVREWKDTPPGPRQAQKPSSSAPSLFE